MEGYPNVNSMDYRRQMADIWKRVFCDSDDYISLFFNNYFSEKYSRCLVKDGKVVAMLFGVPYKFSGLRNIVAGDCRNIHLGNESESGDDRVALNGLYLCGLATIPEYRGRGIMRQLLDDIEKTAREDGFDFTFLIPADDGLITFYEDRSYSACMYRTINRYTSEHDFLHVASALNNFDKSRYDSHEFHELQVCDSCLMHGIYNLIYAAERCDDYICLNHSVRDFDVVLEEALSSGSKIFYTSAKQNEVTSFAIVSASDEDEIVISHLYSLSVEAAVAIMSGIKKYYKDKNIVLYDYPENSRRISLWQPYFEAAPSDNIEDDFASDRDSIYYSELHSSIYGMTRILNVSSFLRIAASLSPKQKNYIHISDTDEDFILEDGQCRRMNTDDKQRMEYDSNQHITTLSRQQLGEILFRRWSADDIIGMAFGLPRIPMNMANLLD